MPKASPVSPWMGSVQHGHTVPSMGPYPEPTLAWWTVWVRNHLVPWSPSTSGWCNHRHDLQRMWAAKRGDSQLYSLVQPRTGELGALKARVMFMMPHGDPTMRSCQCKTWHHRDTQEPGAGHPKTSLPCVSSGRAAGMGSRGEEELWPSRQGGVAQHCPSSPPRLLPAQGAPPRLMWRPGSGLRLFFGFFFAPWF